MINESDPDSKPSANPHISVHNMSLICKFMYRSVKIIINKYRPADTDEATFWLHHVEIYTFICSDL